MAVIQPACHILLEKLTALEKLVATDVPRSADNSKDEFYIVGSSLLREVKDADVTNGVVKAIHGGKISDVKKNIQEIKNKLRNIVTQIGGNDLDDDKVTVENVSSEYELLLTETRNRFPESNIIISGLPPRFNNDTIRAKVK